LPLPCSASLQRLLVPRRWSYRRSLVIPEGAFRCRYTCRQPQTQRSMRCSSEQSRIGSGCFTRRSAYKPFRGALSRIKRRSGSQSALPLRRSSWERPTSKWMTMASFAFLSRSASLLQSNEIGLQLASSCTKSRRTSLAMPSAYHTAQIHDRSCAASEELLRSGNPDSVYRREAASEPPLGERRVRGTLRGLLERTPTLTSADHKVRSSGTTRQCICVASVIAPDLQKHPVFFQ
jgi:hypothetical protein